MAWFSDTCASLSLNLLTHISLIQQICVVDLGHCWLRWLPLSKSVMSNLQPHPRNIFPVKCGRDKPMFIHNILLKISPVILLPLCPGRCVNLTVNQGLIISWDGILCTPWYFTTLLLAHTNTNIYLFITVTYVWWTRTQICIFKLSYCSAKNIFFKLYLDTKIVYACHPYWMFSTTIPHWKLVHNNAIWMT